jgi:hypothetical protein
LFGRFGQLWVSSVGACSAGACSVGACVHRRFKLTFLIVFAF